MRKFNKFKIFLFVLAAATVYAACRKTDQHTGEPTQPNSELKFFSRHASSDPLVQAIAQFVKGENSKYNFVGKLIKQIGYPHWDKTMIVTETGKKMAQRNSSEEDTVQISYIPFVRDSQNYVNASLIVKTSPTDTVFQFLLDWQYGAANTNNSSIWDARDVFILFATLDKFVFDRNQFRITDSVLLTQEEKVAIAASGGNFGNSTVIYNLVEIISPTQSNLIAVPVCYDITSCVAENLVAKSSLAEIVPGPICPPGSIAFTTTECTTIWINFPSGGGGGGTGGTGGGTGGGAGGGEWTPPNYPCGGGPASRTEVQTVCGTGWTPIGPVNQHGYYYNRLDSLYNLLLSNPYFLIDPCNYLTQFGWIGNFQVPTSVTNRIDSINQAFFAVHGPSAYNNFLEAQFYIRNLNSAYGTVVNCDYFPIHISTLPVVNGVPWTAEQLFDHFRRNKNQFINTSIANFAPYDDGWFLNDSIKWYSTNPAGALLHLSMINDGTVIVSDYYSTTDSVRYIVSTLNSPLDGIHPVSGNRVWGIKPDNTNGGYLFYTTAVDRITNPFFDLFNDLGEMLPIPSGFEQADDLWRSMQNKMINFINSHGGSAAKYSATPEVTFRPHWILMKEYLKGNITLQQLKQALGCP